jgi:hypothetical protein
MGKIRTALVATVSAIGFGLAAASGVSAAAINATAMGDGANSTTIVEKAQHWRWGSHGHWRWGSHGHWRWGSHGHWRWGSHGRRCHWRHDSRWRWCDRW